LSATACLDRLSEEKVQKRKQLRQVKSTCVDLLRKKRVEPPRRGTPKAKKPIVSPLKNR